MAKFHVTIRYKQTWEDDLEIEATNEKEARQLALTARTERPRGVYCMDQRVIDESPVPTIRKVTS